MAAIIFVVAVVNLVLGYALAVYLKHGALPCLTLPGHKRVAAPVEAPTSAETPAAS
jgi:hypothetical protein